MTRFIIHAGSHKTGTTSFQYALNKNREILQSQGIYYPDTSAIMGGRPEAHHNIAHALSRFTIDDKRSLSELKSHLVNACKQYHTILLSSEAFYSQIALPLGITELDVYGDRLDENFFNQQRKVYMDRMRQYFEGFDSAITLYFRRPDEYVESVYSSGIVNSQLKIDFINFLNSRTFRFKYAEQLSDFREYFSHVSCFSFDERKQGNFLNNLFEDHGLGKPILATPAKLRTAVPKCAAMWILRDKNKQDFSIMEIRRRFHFALLETSRAIFGEDKPSAFWPSKQARDQIVASSLAHFDEFSFDIPPTIPQQVLWSEDMHAEAGQIYGHWVSDNIEAINHRKKAKIPPYIINDVDTYIYR